MPVQPVAPASVEPATVTSASAPAPTAPATAPVAPAAPHPQVPIPPSTPQALVQMLMGALNPYGNHPLASVLPPLAPSAPVFPPMYGFPVTAPMPYNMGPVPGLPPTYPPGYGLQFAGPPAPHPGDRADATRNGAPQTPHHRRRSAPSRSPVTPSPSRRRHRDASPNSDDGNGYAAPVPVYNPHLDEWLHQLDADPARGMDQQNYQQYGPSFAHLGLLRLDDLLPLTVNDLCGLIPGMSVGVAGRLIRFASEDHCTECISGGRDKRRRYH